MNLGDVGEMNVPPTQDLGAREHAFESQDLSLLWVLERLAIESDEKLLGLFDAVMSTPMRDMVESPMFEPVKCRFVLRRLVRTVEVNDEQNCGLDYLNRLADDDPVRYGALKPPTDLLVQVRLSFLCVSKYEKGREWRLKGGESTTRNQCSAVVLLSRLS